MKTITKALVGTIAAGAVAMTSASPAFAQRDRGNDRDRDGGISAGEVIAGALIIGGIAAVAASADNGRYNNDRYDSRVYGANRSREAVEQCVSAAERRANRYSYGGRAAVTDIRSVQRNRDGFNVRGRIAVNEMRRNWRNGDRNYGRGWNGDYRGANQQLRGYDSGSFTCKVRYGQVASLNFSGIRGLG